ncbi:hypothetical protein HanPI659440_Chr04g0168091 [Helianthus annuus]|nr:hypothetical protein HanPI659440_Chr04g0168091 [Helianthus annuus]
MSMLYNFIRDFIIVTRNNYHFQCQLFHSIQLSYFSMYLLSSLHSKSADAKVSRKQNPLFHVFVGFWQHHSVSPTDFIIFVGRVIPTRSTVTSSGASNFLTIRGGTFGSNSYQSPTYKFR